MPQPHSVVTQGRKAGVRIGYNQLTKHTNWTDERLGERMQELCNLMQDGAAYIQGNTESDAISLIRAIRLTLQRHGALDEEGLRGNMVPLRSHSP